MKKNLIKSVSLLLLSGLLMCSMPSKAWADNDFKLEDIVPLKDAVCETMGDDTIVGAAATLDDLRRNGVQALIEKHFNAVTLGNELKPDALFGYSNGSCPGKHSVEFNGETMEVPTFDFSRAENALNIIYDWNQAHPDQFIKVRGHVLVWHSQTPEWFFHVDYDKNKDYVTPKEMNKRLEWYISEVFNHFTGPESKYAGMFYGWDVVNEAISDGTHSYRTDAENPSESLSRDTHGSNSSWWHVYQSNEFIINAFKYANKYAPADIDLYYNDYNDCVYAKCTGICQLIEDVKKAPGTRIDGFGMQGHYSAADNTSSSFSYCVEKYLETGVKVMITEWDLKAHDDYDPSDLMSVYTEYTRMGHHYKSVYDILVKLKAEGKPIAGFVFWGTIDKLSWLQSRNDVGGASDGKMSQCPLLFDDDYHAKPAYWAFVDPDHISDTVVAYKEQLKAEKENAASADADTDKTEVNDNSDADADTDKAEVNDNSDADTSIDVSANVSENDADVSSSDADSNDTGKKSGNAAKYGGITAVILLIGSSLALAASRKKKAAELNDQGKNDKQQ